jgi:hypothetical protein
MFKFTATLASGSLVEIHGDFAMRLSNKFVLIWTKGDPVPLILGPLMF